MTQALTQPVADEVCAMETPEQQAKRMGFGAIQMSAGMQQRHVGDVVVAAREEAIMKASVAMAALKPRDPLVAATRILAACDRHVFADKAFYKYRRGKDVIRGPSIYFAREAAGLWGNIRYGGTILERTDDYCHGVGWAYDAETNTWSEHATWVQMLIQRKRGEGRQQRTVWEKPDERNALELINRSLAKATRTAVLERLPFDLIQECKDRTLQTLERHAAGELKDDRQGAIRKLISGFEPIGVSPEMLERYAGCKLADLTPQHFADLRAVYTSMVSGETNRDDHFQSLSSDDLASLRGTVRQLYASLPKDEANKALAGAGISGASGIAECRDESALRAAQVGLQALANTPPEASQLDPMSQAIADFQSAEYKKYLQEQAQEQSQQQGHETEKPAAQPEDSKARLLALMAELPDDVVGTILRQNEIAGDEIEHLSDDKVQHLLDLFERAKLNEIQKQKDGKQDRIGGENPPEPEHLRPDPTPPPPLPPTDDHRFAHKPQPPGGTSKGKGKPSKSDDQGSLI